MFWKFNNASSPQFEAVLQKEGVTLQELMEEEDIIQECKSQNKKLVEFLCQRNVLEELVTLITEEPSEELDERNRFKYPNIACELLTCDVPALNESLSRDNELLEKLYSFIDKDPPLNPLLASFLSRTLGVLIVKRLDQHWISYQLTCLQAMGFLKDKENFLSLLLKHLGTSAIMDLTLKLITEVGDVEHRQNLLNWLDSQNLVQSLVALFDPQVDSDRHLNASQLLCDVLRISRDAFNDHRERMDADPILARLESPDTVSLLLDYILGGKEKSESSIVGGIQVLLALLGHKNSFNDNNLAYNNAYDETELERKQKIAQSTADVLVGRLKDFHSILLEPPKKPAVRTTIGILDPPLGNTRLQVTKLLAALIAIDNDQLLRELMRLGTMELLLDLFFKYVWNNFLHAQVQQCIAAALNAHVKPMMTGGEDNVVVVVAADEEQMRNSGGDNVMYSYLIVQCRLLDRILEAWDDNEQKQAKDKGIRQGYMGHLINIADGIVQQCNVNQSFDDYINEHLNKDTLEAWNHFVHNSLAAVNSTQRVVLGGVHPKNLCGDDSNEDYNIPYPQAAVLQQQMYNEYQMQQMSGAPDLIASYGFHDDEFTDPDDPLQLQRRANINLLNESELHRQAEMFKKVCSGYINTLDDGDADDDAIFDDEREIASSEPKPLDDNWDPRADSNTTDEALLDNTAAPCTDEPGDPWAALKANIGSRSSDSTTIAVAAASAPPSVVVAAAASAETNNDPWANVFTSSSDDADVSAAPVEDGWANFDNFTPKFDSEMLVLQSSGDNNVTAATGGVIVAVVENTSLSSPPPPPSSPLQTVVDTDSNEDSSTETSPTINANPCSETPAVASGEKKSESPIQVGVPVPETVAGVGDAETTTTAAAAADTSSAIVSV